MKSNNFEVIGLKEEDYLKEFVKLNNDLINTQRMLEKSNYLLEEKNRLLNEKYIELENALLEIKKLKRLIPICIKCKKIRDDKGYWTEVEDYFRQHTDFNFSHGYCESCFKIEYPEFADQIIEEIKNENALIKLDKNRQKQI